MPSPVTAYSVKLVSPGDAGMELVIAREVISDWNALHALEQKRVLLPLHPDLAATSPSDLLVAFFCAAQGTSGKSSESVETEIEKQVKDGRPALVYYSEGRTNLAGMNALESHAWEDFKKRFESRAVIDSFSDEKEFRAKFAQHLAVTVSTHAHFKADEPVPVPTPVTPPATTIALPAVQPDDHSLIFLSTEARALITEACDDPEAYIGRSRDNNGFKLQANGKQFVPAGNPAATAVWEKAFEELLSRELIRDAGCKGRLFQISAKGFDYLKTIGKSPVGYISELGGM